MIKTDNLRNALTGLLLARKPVEIGTEDILGNFYLVWYCLCCGEVAPIGVDLRDMQHKADCSWIKAKKTLSGG